MLENVARFPDFHLSGGADEETSKRCLENSLVTALPAAPFFSVAHRERWKSGNRATKAHRLGRIAPRKLAGSGERISGGDRADYGAEVIKKLAKEVVSKVCRSSFLRLLKRATCGKRPASARGSSRFGEKSSAKGPSVKGRPWGGRYAPFVQVGLGGLARLSPTCAQCLCSMGINHSSPCPRGLPFW